MCKSWKILWERKKLWLPFHHFLTKYSKAFHLRVVKTHDCMVNGSIKIGEHKKKKAVFVKHKYPCNGHFLINPFPNNAWFLRVCCTSLLKTLGKEEIARNEQFLLFPQCFLPF